MNVPVPSEVGRLAAVLGSTCRTADVRTRHTLVVKRLGDGDHRQLADRVREAVAGTPPFAARVTRLDSFDLPTSGTAPVVYLAVESPGLGDLHGRLCEAFDTVPNLEGDDYVPHVTVARGGDAADLLGEEFEPVEWTVDRLVLWDGTHREPVESIALPA